MSGRTKHPTDTAGAVGNLGAILAANCGVLLPPPTLAAPFQVVVPGNVIPQPMGERAQFAVPCQPEPSLNLSVPASGAVNADVGPSSARKAHVYSNSVQRICGKIAEDSKKVEEAKVELSYMCKEGDVYKVVAHAVKDGLTQVEYVEANNKYISKYVRFPSLSYFSSGMPHFTQEQAIFHDTPRDYSSLFSKEIPPESMNSWRMFWELVQFHEKLRYYYHVNTDQQDFPLSRFTAFGALANLVNRYIHVNRSKSFQEHLFLPIYQEWENCVFAEELSFDIGIPILLTHFNFESTDIKDGCAVAKMSDDLQLARNKGGDYSFSTNYLVTGAATHALILKGWSAKNQPWLMREHVLGNLDAYTEVIARVDLFIAALRIVTGIDTGYAQLLVLAKGWGEGWTAYLPHVMSVSIRMYPDHFENHGWLREVPTVTIEQVQEALDIYDRINKVQSKKLLLAIRRLNAAYLRKADEDSILDVTMGLETLLVDDGRNEITYRLSMRLAALSKIMRLEMYKPSDIFALCKKVYDYRSAIIHGAQNADKKRTIQLPEQLTSITATNIGLILLRHAINVLSLYPEFLDPNKIDQILLSKEEEVDMV